MSASLVPCPVCGRRRQLVSINVQQRSDIRRFRCVPCATESEYVIKGGKVEIVDDEKSS